MGTLYRLYQNRGREGGRERENTTQRCECYVDFITGIINYRCLFSVKYADLKMLSLGCRVLDALLANAKDPLVNL